MVPDQIVQKFQHSSATVLDQFLSDVSNFMQIQMYSMKISLIKPQQQVVTKKSQSCV